MKRYQLLLIVSLVFFLTACGLKTEASKVPENLGNYPLCEPSAVVKIACQNKDKNCLLVGDNEINDTVFVYPLDSDKLEAKKQQELSLKNVKISDIEAIANLANNQFIIVGSHSRNGECQTKKSRRRWVQAKLSNNSIQPIEEIIQTPKIDSKILFNDADIESDNTIEAVAQAIDNAEKAANLAEGSREDCSTTNHFNIEGVVAINDDSAKSSIWMGMRSPLVTVEDKKLAILLHLKNINSYQFDRVAVLDLGGRGIRELTLWQNDLWGIAGGPEDGLDNFVLWQFPIELLESNKIIEPQIVRPLPTSSEGLVFIDSTTAYVLIDGDLGNSNANCLGSGKFFKLEIP